MRTLSLFPVLVGLSGCTSGGPIHVNTYWGTRTRAVDKGASFAWLADAPADVDANSRVNKELGGFVRENINARLMDMGYTEHSGTTPAGFLVTYRIGRRTEQAQTGFDSWEVADLTIEFLESADRQLIWRGWAEAEIDYSLPPDDRRKRIERAVRAILRQFQENT